MRLRSSLRSLSLSVVAAFAILGCAAEPLGVPQNDPPVPQQLLGLDNVVGGLVSTTGQVLRAVLSLLTCPLESSKTAAASIGPNGGTLRVGRHLLTVPRGALSRTVRIEGRTSGDRTASVLFKPEGLRFSKPVTLKLDYGPCANIRNPKKVVYVTDDGKQILEVLRSVDYPRSEVVDGEVDHFSRYAVAW